MDFSSSFPPDPRRGVDIQTEAFRQKRRQRQRQQLRRVRQHALLREALVFQAQALQQTEKHQLRRQRSLAQLSKKPQTAASGLGRRCLSTGKLNRPAGISAAHREAKAILSSKDQSAVNLITSVSDFTPSLLYFRQILIVSNG